MKRIRYTEQDGKKISNNIFETNKGDARIVIDVSSNTFQIVKESNKTVLESGRGKTIYDVQKKAKEMIKLLGGTFAGEERERNKELLKALGIDY
jgi:hypothetical protein